jgi:hypothetical protein
VKVMNARDRGVLARWDRFQWVGQREGQQPSVTVQPQRPRWRRWQWVGRAGVGDADESAIGDSGLSGFGHTPDSQRWFEPSESVSELTESDTGDGRSTPS